MMIPKKFIKRNKDINETKILINHGGKHCLYLAIHIMPWFPLFYAGWGVEGRELTIDFGGYMFHLIYYRTAV